MHVLAMFFPCFVVDATERCRRLFLNQWGNAKRILVLMLQVLLQFHFNAHSTKVSVLFIMDTCTEDPEIICSNIPRRNYVQGTSRRLLFACNAYINNQMKNVTSIIYIVTFIVRHVHEAKRWVFKWSYFLDSCCFIPLALLRT